MGASLRYLACEARGHGPFHPSMPLSAGSTLTAIDIVLTCAYSTCTLGYGYCQVITPRLPDQTDECDCDIGEDKIIHCHCRVTNLQDRDRSSRKLVLPNGEYWVEILHRQERYISFVEGTLCLGANPRFRIQCLEFQGSRSQNLNTTES